MNIIFFLQGIMVSQAQHNSTAACSRLRLARRGGLISPWSVSLSAKPPPLCVQGSLGEVQHTHTTLHNLLGSHLDQNENKFEDLTNITIHHIIAKQRKASRISIYCRMMSCVVPLFTHPEAAAHESPPENSLFGQEKVGPTKSKQYQCQISKKARKRAYRSFLAEVIHTTIW